MNHNNSTIVRNVNGTSKDRFKIDDLSRKFVESGGTTSGRCQAKGCKNAATATAHVAKTDGRRDNNQHLTKLCAEHNHHTNNAEIPLRKNAKLVSVAEVRKR
jgi:hypothetical protein